jgi:phospholipase/carboxylesterase
MKTAFALSEADLALQLPLRQGPRPRSCWALPYVQLDQWPPVEMVKELFSQCLGFPNVRAKQSRMASPESRALSLPDAFAAGPPSAFIDGHEFCHLHPPPEGSIHLTLPTDLRKRAVHQEWAEQHPAARLGAMPETLVMVYAPRNSDELGIVLRLVLGSYHFAAGQGENG